MRPDCHDFFGFSIAMPFAQQPTPSGAPQPVAEKRLRDGHTELRCGAASTRNNLTGYKDVRSISGYLKRKVFPEPMWCPPCVLTQEDAAGGLVGLGMTVEKAQAEFALHWLLNEDLAEAHDAAEQDAPDGELDAGSGGKRRGHGKGPDA